MAITDGNISPEKKKQNHSSIKTTKGILSVQYTFQVYRLEMSNDEKEWRLPWAQAAGDKNEGQQARRKQMKKDS